MLDPGTAWPECGGVPLSLFAVLDLDVLAPWLGDLVPDGTGVLNFFYLDGHSDLAAPAAVERALEFALDAPEVGAVVPARPGLAAETDAPGGCSVFASVAWTVSPGFAFPDDYDPAWDVLGAGTDAVRDYIATWNPDSDWPERPGALYSTDLAFGWPAFPTGSASGFPDAEASRAHQHLLQLSEQDDWHMGGDGGWMHWSIPVEALRAGDFRGAVPTPDYW